jgi:hypothetical protein
MLLGPNRTGGLTDYTGSVHFKDQLRNWTAKNRVKLAGFL